MGSEKIAEVSIDRATARIYEHGWQSWSPSGWYDLHGARPPRPTAVNHHVMAYRWGVDQPTGPGQFQGEGLLAVAHGPGSDVDVFSSAGVDRVASIQAEVVGDQVMVRADGPVQHARWSAPQDPDQALAGWAASFAAVNGALPVRRYGPSWCSWYAYWGQVTEADVLREARTLGQHSIPVDLVLLDEGYQAAIGDWLAPRDGFGSTLRLATRLRQDGYRPGIWVAPFLVAEDSELARSHPEWLVPQLSAGHNWGRDQRVLDTTHPGAAAHLRTVFSELVGQGYDHFKLDFLYAGALEGRRHSGADAITAYREGLSLLREVVGPHRTLHGCGAPILPSLGLVDTMRVSPDTGPRVEPETGDVSQPGQHGARITSRARDFLHGRFWANDPDCLIVQPGTEDREHWADHIAASPGLRMSSDPIGALDGWALARTRELLVPSCAEPSIVAGSHAVRESP